MNTRFKVIAYYNIFQYLCDFIHVLIFVIVSKCRKKSQINENSDSTERCWAMQTNTWTLCNAKVKTGKHGTLAPTYKGLQKEYRSTNNVEYEFWCCLDDIKRCISGSKKKCVLDWRVVPNTWFMKIGTNLSRHKVLAFEYVGFQLQQKEVLSPRYRLSTIATLPIYWTDFRVSLDPDAIQVQKDSVLQSRSTNGRWQKQMRERRTHGRLLCGWSNCHSISKIWSLNQHRLQRGHHISCHNCEHATLYVPWLHENVISVFGKERKMDVLQTSLLCMFRFLCKVDYGSDKFIHAPTYSYNEVRQLLELAVLVDCE